MPSIALTTTARNLDLSFTDWCDYHLALVDRLFIWIDNADELNSTLIPYSDRIQVALGCQANFGNRHANLMYRQEFNATKTVNLCCSIGVQWLMHLDTDELLYPPDKDILREQLTVEIDQLVLTNHEVVPVWAALNPFRECEYFKVNGRYPFNFYANGKALVRCRTGVFARDAHSFGGPISRTAKAKRCGVLHYACSTFDRWLAKYANLGDFSSFWWDDPRHPITLPFHTHSRDLYRFCLQNNDYEPARTWWQSQLLSEFQIASLLEKEKIRRYTPFETLSTRGQHRS